MKLANEWFPTGKFIKFDTSFRTVSTYEKKLMAALPLTVNSPHKAKMEYNGEFGNTLVRIQHITLMSRIDICYTSCCLETQRVAHTIPGFQGINHCIQYLYSHPHKPIFYPSNYYYGSNVIILKWSGIQIEDYTTQNCLELHQDADHAKILTEDGLFQVLSILFLGFLSSRKYRFSQLWPLTPLMDKLYACTSLSIKLSLSCDT